MKSEWWRLFSLQITVCHWWPTLSYFRRPKLYTLATDVTVDVEKAGYVVVVVGGSCPDGWHYYSGTHSCFYVSTTKVDQSTARMESQNLGAELASVTDEAEMNFVNSISFVVTLTL